MVSFTQDVSVSSSNLITTLFSTQPSSELIHIFLKNLKENRDNLKIVIASLEVLVVLLKNDETTTFADSSANIVDLCATVMQILE